MNFKEWQEIKEEFGSDAYKRVYVNTLDARDSNDEIQRIIDDFDCVKLKLKPLPELFAHDVDVYGDNAFFMWETHNGLQFDSNASVLKNIKTGLFSITRKTSAAMPFDIERAKKGDVVTYGIKEDAVTNFVFPDHTDYAICGDVNGIQNVFWNYSNLRMKYPPKKE